MHDLVIGITGSNGQLGSELRSLAARFPQAEFHFYTREELPINDEAALRSVFQQLAFTHWVNCAAYTAVDLAEKERDAAFDINGKAVGSMAALCKEHEVHFIHISTDYVFDGSATTPIEPGTPTRPVNTYGASKEAGEKMAMENNNESLIIRTSWVYSSFGKNFVKTMIRLMTERESISVVNDQLGSPTYAADLAEAIMDIITSGKWLPGIYHFSNAGVISWFQFAQAIKDRIGSACTVNAITTEQFPTPAKRPAYSVMDTSKLTSAYGIRMKDWRESLDTCIQLIRAGR